MNNNLLKIALIAFTATTTHTFATVWHPLTVNTEMPEPMQDATDSTTIDPTPVAQPAPLVRSEIKKDDFKENHHTQADLNHIAPPSKLKVGLSIGTLTAGEAKESLYLPQRGNNISLLTWDIKNSPILKSDITWQVNPWLAFNANGWTTYSVNNSTMNDYDWQDDAHKNTLTDHSIHSDTHLNSAGHIDLNTQVWVIQKPEYKVGLTAGYQVEHFSWTAKGGHYKYGITDSNGNYTSSVQGNFPTGQTVGGYQQKFKTPYLGLMAEYQHENFELNAKVKMSKWNKSSSQDEHYLRKMTGYANANHGDYFSASINAGYYIMPYTKLFTEVTWTQFKRSLGSLTIKEKGQTIQYPQYAEQTGTANKYLGLGAGIQYEF